MLLEFYIAQPLQLSPLSLRVQRCSTCKVASLQFDDVQVNVPDAQLEKLDALEGSWATFRSCLDETANILERAKDTFRDKLVQMVDTFSTDVVVSRDMFTQDAPYSNEVGRTANAKA